MKETTMKRISHVVIAALVACLFATTATASAASTTRTATKAYTMANGMITGSSAAYWTIGAAMKTFRALPGERKVVISVADEVGTDTRAQIYSDKDGDGDIERIADFCTKSKPIPVTSGQRIQVAVMFGECPNGDMSIVTEGTITAEFSK